MDLSKEELRTIIKEAVSEAVQSEKRCRDIEWKIWLLNKAKNKVSWALGVLFSAGISAGAFTLINYLTG